MKMTMRASDIVCRGIDELKTNYEMNGKHVGGWGERVGACNDILSFRNLWNKIAKSFVREFTPSMQPDLLLSPKYVHAARPAIIFSHNIL